MGIVRLRVKNYRGIEALDAPIAPHGVIARGGNGRGKTSVLRAIRDALAAQDVGTHAIRLGADKAEILVDLDDVTVKRAISRKGGSTLRVETKAGDLKAKPQTYLNELLGTAPLDPLDFFLADAKKRRQIVLGALPVKLTLEHLPEEARAEAAPQLLELHGLEACAEIHRVFYSRRADANAAVKQKRAHLEELETAIAQLSAKVPAGTPTLADARASADAANVELVKLQTRAERATQQAERFVSTREKIRSLRANAEELRKSIGDVPRVADVDAAEGKLTQARARVLELERELKKAHADVEVLDQQARHLVKLRDRASDLENAAVDAERQAAALDDTIAAATEAPPTAEQIGTAASAYTDACKRIEAAELAGKLAALRTERDQHAKETEAAEVRAEKLTDVVDALAKKVPAALIAASDGIPGLGIDGDTITLDGIPLDGLCGREQMKFAIDLARRANAKAKILVVDGLERIDRDTIDEFVSYATRDGWQLIASRVDAGDMVLEAIEPEKAEAAE